VSKGCGEKMEWYEEGYVAEEWQCGDAEHPLCSKCNPPPLNFRVGPGDPINPEYYKKPGELEMIDQMRRELTPEEFIGFCKGCCIKYMYRVGFKGNAEVDHRKLVWYLAWVNGVDPRTAKAVTFTQGSTLGNPKD